MGRYYINNTDMDSKYKSVPTWPSYMTTAIQTLDINDTYINCSSYIESNTIQGMYATTDKITAYQYPGHSSYYLVQKYSAPIPKLVEITSDWSITNLSPFKSSNLFTTTTYIKYKNSGIYWGTSSSNISNFITNSDGLFIACIGGGGGGGGSAISNENNWANRRWSYSSGGAGGSGGCCIVYVNLKLMYNMDHNAYIILQPGSAGSGGTTSYTSAFIPSLATGGDGTSGSSSYITCFYNNKTYNICTCYGGSGGKGGKANADSNTGLYANSAGGTAGNHFVNTAYPMSEYVIECVSCNGGDGGTGFNYRVDNTTETSNNYNAFSYTPTPIFYFPFNTSYPSSKAPRDIYMFNINNTKYKCPLWHKDSAISNYFGYTTYEACWGGAPGVNIFNTIILDTYGYNGGTNGLVAYYGNQYLGAGGAGGAARWNGSEVSQEKGYDGKPGGFFILSEI